jgi:hypothetical protein
MRRRLMTGAPRSSSDLDIVSDDAFDQSAAVTLLLVLAGIENASALLKLRRRYQLGLLPLSRMADDGDFSLKWSRYQ